MPLGIKPFENTVAKGEIAPNELVTVFSTGLNNFLPFSSNFKLLSAKSFNLEESSGNGLSGICKNITDDIHKKK